MKKYLKYILCFGALCFSLFFSTSKILAASCTKVGLNGHGTSGIVCSQAVPGVCTASCASGWSTSCGLVNISVLPVRLDVM